MNEHRKRNEQQQQHEITTGERITMRVCTRYTMSIRTATLIQVGLS